MAGMVAVSGKKQRVRTFSEKLAAGVYREGRVIPQEHDDEQSSVRLLVHSKSEPGTTIQSESWLCSYIGYPKFRSGSFDEESLRELEDLLTVDPENAFLSLRGHYQLYLYNKINHTSYYVNDRISSHPWYLLSFSACLIGSSDPFSFRSLKKSGWPGTINHDVIPHFMASGVLWGDETYYKDVRRLGAGQYARYSEGECTVKSYWRFQFQPVSRTMNEKKEILLDAIKKDFSNIPSGKGVVTLSGGVDSRGIAAVSQMMNLDVDAVSYSFTEELVPNSDIDVAQSVASKMGLSHVSYLSKGENFIDNLTKILRSTGGETDVACAQESFLGKDFYSILQNNYEYLLRGDEFWGGPDSIRSTGEAFISGYMFNLDEFGQPQHLLTPGYFSKFVQEIDEQRSILARDSESNRSGKYTDFRDELCWYQYQTRMVSNTAYYRRGFIPHITPFLFDNTIDVMLTIPPEDRIKKRLFRSTMKSLFPDIFNERDRVTRRHTGLHLENIIRKDRILRELIRDVLVENPPDEMREIFLNGALTSWVDGVLQTENNSLAGAGRNHYFALHTMNNYLRKIPVLRSLLINILHSKNMLRFPVVNANYIFRLTVLGLALREYNANPVVDTEKLYSEN